MFRNKLPLLIYFLISLALFGFVFDLFSNTGTLIKNLLIMIGFGVVVFGAIYYFLLRNRTPNNDIKKYKKAVRQSKNRYKQDKLDKKQIVRSSSKQQPLMKKRATKASATHLRVIDGNKQKRKNRASF